MMAPVSPPTRRSLWTAFLLSALGSLLLFGVLTYPLIKFGGQAIPSSAQNIENPAWRSSIPGDHLQLLYHFDLVSGMFSGEVPWMHNIYEFNTGSIEDRFRPGSYFFPMSAVYAGLKVLTGKALAWNISLWISVWLSAFFSWMWLRRFTDQKLPLLFGILLMLLIPSRWISLLGGSPAGFALMYVPLYAWCLDLAVRKPTYRAGFGAGACLLLLMWADLQTFYFTAITTPVFLLVSLTACDEDLLQTWKSRCKALPGLLLFLGLIAWFYVWRKQHLVGSAMETGRSIEELALYSPFKRSFFIPGSGKEGKVYFGWGVLSALLLAGGCVLFQVRSHIKSFRFQTVAWLLLIPAIVFCAFLATGVHGPFEFLPIRMVRALIPHYDMIRQPAKIMLVFPLWIGWLLAVLWAKAWPVKLDRLKTPLLCFCALWMTWELKNYVSATICLLPEETAAYEVIREQPETTKPHLLVVPLWPGDSSDTSVPMILAQETRIPLLNGYSPVVRMDYLEQRVRPLESVNMGWLTEEQIDHLASIHISHLVVHENMFPEKVSPFPIIRTLDRLDAHPRLEKIQQQGSVHTYRILPEPVKKELGMHSRGFPARTWRFDPLTQCSAIYKMPPSSQQFLWLRVKGKGIISIRPRLEEEDLTPMVFNVDTEDWVWRSFRMADRKNYGRFQLCLGGISETAEIDRGLIVEGDWPVLPLRSPFKLQAAEFFHAGHVMEDGTTVKLRQSHEPDSIVFYGPRMPLGRGNFQAELILKEMDSAQGEQVGEFRVRVEGQPDGEWVPVITGQPAVCTFESQQNLPVDAQFRFNRREDVMIEAVVFSPVQKAGK